MPLVQLGSGRSDDQERDALGAIRQMLQEREHRIVRPVQVLEHQHRRRASAMCSSHRRHAVNSSSRSADERRLDPQQRQQSLAKPGPLLALGQHHVELRGDGGRSSDSRIPAWAFTISPSAQNVIPSPYGRHRPCRQVTKLRPCVDVAAQLGHDPALAKARLAHHRDQLHRLRRHRLLEDPLQQREIDLPADKRRGVRTRQVRPKPRSGSQRLKHTHRLGLALHRRRLELLIVEHHCRRLICRYANGHAHLRRNALQPRGGVDRIAGQEPLARPGTHPQPHERLAGVDPHPQPQRLAPHRLAGPPPPPRSEGPPAPPAPDRPHAPPAHRTRPPPHHR